MVKSENRSIADWLVWRRDVASNLQRFLLELRQKIESARNAARNKGVTLTSGEGSRPDDIIVNINEQMISKNIEHLEEILGTLDGLLSLKNATITLDI